MWPKARQMVSVALRLLPDNRFVVRSAARLFVHQNDLHRAHETLLATSRLRQDPWLLAAEIAVASAAKHTSRLIKHGLTMLDTGRHSPFHLSELASSIATLELEAGNTRRARKLLALSLVSPSENALAQAAWLNRNVSVVLLDEAVLTQSVSWEANAWEAFRKGNWRIAMGEARNWLLDQPFSGRPAVLGSYIAAVCLESNEDSIEIAKLGLMANPNDKTLLNNLAFALARLDRTTEARQFLRRIDPAGLSQVERIAWLATSGLLRYREGAPLEGETLYRDAISLADKTNNAERGALAQMYFALEQRRLGQSGSGPRLVEVATVFRKSVRPDLQYLAKQLERGTNAKP
jgi:tetratricopeptide (TPR) repeat protein